MPEFVSAIKKQGEIKWLPSLSKIDKDYNIFEQIQKVDRKLNVNSLTNKWLVYTYQGTREQQNVSTSASGRF